MKQPIHHVLYPILYAIPLLIELCSKEDINSIKILQIIIDTNGIIQLHQLLTAKDLISTSEQIQIKELLQICNKLSLSLNKHYLPLYIKQKNK